MGFGSMGEPSMSKPVSSARRILGRRRGYPRLASTLTRLRNFHGRGDVSNTICPEGEQKWPETGVPHFGYNAPVPSGAFNG